jgi:Flp pilus assembly protein TadG
MIKIDRCQMQTNCRSEKQSIRQAQNLHSESGASLVEFALLLPVFLLILLGTVDLGLGMRTYMGLANAAREGARWASAYPSDTAGTQAVVAAEAARAGVAAGELTTTITTASGTGGTTVTVTVMHSYPTLFGALTGMGAIPMQALATMPVVAS